MIASMPPLPSLVADAARELRRALEREFPGRVVEVTIFGSTARGEATEESDVDVLVLFAEASFAERARAMDLATEIGFASDLVFSPLVMSVGEWRELERRERRLPREIRKDGVPA